MIADSFNENEHGLVFELEKPTGNCLNLLDFGITILNGHAKISFYQKQSRSNIFVNFSSHLPIKSKRNFAINEWNRILRKCKNARQVKKNRLIFISKMVSNGYPMNMIKKWTKTSKPTVCHTNNSNDGIFYLSIPYVNDGVNKAIRKSLAPLGLNIRLSHKSYKLMSWLKPVFKNVNNKCSLTRCKLRNKDCLKSMVVYECKCVCGASYIGSTERALHIRVKEHHSLHNSAMFQHRLLCDGVWTTRIIANGKDLTDLRLKEAILINQRHPSLNKKEEVKHFELVV
jgi:predicted GIY-YIG superfamily endonuclease